MVLSENYGIWSSTFGAWKSTFQHMLQGILGVFNMPESLCGQLVAEQCWMIEKALLVRWKFTALYHQEPRNYTKGMIYMIGKTWTMSSLHLRFYLRLGWIYVNFSITFSLSFLQYLDGGFQHHINLILLAYWNNRKFNILQTSLIIILDTSEECHYC